MITKMWDDYGKQKRMEVRISFKEGGSLYTSFQGSKEAAEKHFVGKRINVGGNRVEMKTCTAITVIS